MGSLKSNQLKYSTIIPSYGLLLIWFLLFLQAPTTSGVAVLVQPIGTNPVQLPSVGIPVAGMGAAGIPMGMGSMGMGSMGVNTMGQGVIMTPMGGNVAQNPPPVVLTDASGETKVVGSANPLTGAIELDANKLKDALGEAAAEEPPPPAEEEAAE
ncbi:uncharacterized protein LOC119445499 [Dermacentor silvarum]|uniref:uncharacterized protein LOC119445499 n=1 Tax=Dermacentor silvarum TaxID=543639 RepID=UPI00189BE078|nr:uncharacterized protein LOC119445499 [Dermacentor silvarum]